MWTPQASASTCRRTFIRFLANVQMRNQRRPLTGSSPALSGPRDRSSLGCRRNERLSHHSYIRRSSVPRTTAMRDGSGTTRTPANCTSPPTLGIRPNSCSLQSSSIASTRPWIRYTPTCSSESCRSTITTSRIHCEMKLRMANDSRANAQAPDTRPATKSSHSAPAQVSWDL